MRSQNFRSKIIVVTGASAGVGRATAIRFGKSGAIVALMARGEDGLKAAAKEVEEAGGRAQIFPLDVSDAEALKNAAQEIENTMGPVDVWVNNAMVSVFSPFADITAKEFQRVTAVTYLGQVYGTMAILPHMLSRNAGHIVLVGSALAYRGIPLQSAYCGAKHGIQGFFDSLRCELLHMHSNVHLSMVELPALNTPQFSWVKSRLPGKPRPMGKVYQPEVAARAILYAASHTRREYFVGYPTFESIYGNRVFPGWLDHILAKNGYGGQQTGEPADPGRKNNLWEPLPGDHGTHGSFGAIAHAHSFTFWLSTHRWICWILLLVLVTGILILLFAY